MYFQVIKADHAHIERTENIRGCIHNDQFVRIIGSRTIKLAVTKIVTANFSFLDNQLEDIMIYL